MDPVIHKLKGAIHSRSFQLPHPTGSSTSGARAILLCVFYIIALTRCEIRGPEDRYSDYTSTCIQMHFEQNTSTNIQVDYSHTF